MRCIDATVFGKRSASSHPTLQLWSWLSEGPEMGCHPGGPYLPSQVSLQEKGRGRGCDTDIRQALRPRRERLNSDKATNQGLRQPQETRRGKNGLSPRKSWGSTFLALPTLWIWAQWYRFQTWPPKSWENKFLLFLTTMFVEICHSNHRN